MWTSRNIVAVILVLLLVSCNLSKLARAADTYIRGNDWKDLLLTSEERDALMLFKSKVADLVPEAYMKSDFYLVRWIRGADLNLDAAQKTLFENIKWRTDNNISSILKEDWFDMRQDYPMSLDAHDKRGRPAATIDFGEWDIRGAALQGKLPRLLRYMDWIQEANLRRILAAQDDDGKNVTRAVILVDLNGLNLLQHLCPSCLSVFMRMMNGMESHYPRFWEEIIVINGPPASRIALEAVRPLMSKQTRDVFKLFETNRNQWMEYLDERISRDQRKANYGGTKEIANHV